MADNKNDNGNIAVDNDRKPPIFYAMTNTDLFNQYLTDRMDKMPDRAKAKLNPPVITISREAGCGAEHIAKKLSAKMNALYPNAMPQWRYINKEVMEKAADKLKMRVDEVERNYNQGHREVVEDLFFSLGTNYYNFNDTKVKKTIVNVVRDFAHQGNMIIVGRAGECLTADLDRVLQTTIHAPLEWRAQNLIRRWGIDKKEALEYIDKNDKKRKAFRDFYAKGKALRYDLSIDASSFTEDEIVELLFQTLKLKKYIK
ncbi:AAA family ATPase [Persicobacter sp. CCB-QB2]|uniref:cytidylate kinase-like family protein n=1 Tax=Persicobacter sp. CCB-QB2 TaxID=1561025 RepID=UPI0006A9FA2F|nr:cytidylate kinase-like family protein [Persicobacter sp. CCB-QB2]